MYRFLIPNSDEELDAASNGDATELTQHEQPQDIDKLRYTKQTLSLGAS